MNKPARDIKIGNVVNLDSYGRGRTGCLVVSYVRKHRRYAGEMQIQGTVQETGQLIDITPKCNELINIL